jgi:hypothetical protein
MDGIVKWVVLSLAVAALPGCTAKQRFALAKNAELDACAMKVMSETKINGQQGYLQAQHECHQRVNVAKFKDLNLQRRPEKSKDPLVEQPICWEYVKGLYIEELYPESPLPEWLPNQSVREEQAQKALEERNNKLHVLPNRINQISDDQLIHIYELMAIHTAFDHLTTCNGWMYRELASSIGREIKKRQG